MQVVCNWELLIVIGKRNLGATNLNQLVKRSAILRKKKKKKQKASGTFTHNSKRTKALTTLIKT